MQTNRKEEFFSYIKKFCRHTYSWQLLWESVFRIRILFVQIRIQPNLLRILDPDPSFSLTCLQFWIIYWWEFSCVITQNILLAVSSVTSDHWLLCESGQGLSEPCGGQAESHQPDSAGGAAECSQHARHHQEEDTERDHAHSLRCV